MSKIGPCTSIKKLGLSARATQVLLRGGITQYASLRDYSELQLLRLPHFGRECLREVRSLLASQGIYAGKATMVRSDDAELEEASR
jgi:DNA-directed RNA polymerase alpha subunit